MIQSLDRQLQVVLRALTEVVTPGVAEADRHVAEQLQLSIATLAFVAKRLPEARRYYRWELAAYLSLARALEANGEGAVARFVTAGAALLERADADIADYEEELRRGREAIAAHAEASGDAAVERLILAHSDAIVGQQRQWCTPFGFELHPASLPAPAW